MSTERSTGRSCVERVQSVVQDHKYASEGQAEAEKVHIDSIAEGRLSSQQIEFELSADLGAGNLRSLVTHTEPALARRHAKILVIAQRVGPLLAGKQGNILDVCQRRVVERIRQECAVNGDRKTLFGCNRGSALGGGLGSARNLWTSLRLIYRGHQSWSEAGPFCPAEDTLSLQNCSQ